MHLTSIEVSDCKPPFRTGIKSIYRILALVNAAFHWLRLRLTIKKRDISFDPGCSITTGVRIRVSDGGCATFGRSVTVDRFADIRVKHGELSVGEQTYIGQFAVICALEKISIGSGCQIAEHVSIRDQDHKFGVGLETIDAGFVTAPVVIENNVWIGAKVTITKGVKIGRNSVVGANSVVTRDVPANTLVAGTPACVLRSIS